MCSPRVRRAAAFGATPVADELPSPITKSLIFSKIRGTFLSTFDLITFYNIFNILFLFLVLQISGEVDHGCCSGKSACAVCRRVRLQCRRCSIELRRLPAVWLPLLCRQLLLLFGSNEGKSSLVSVKTRIEWCFGCYLAKEKGWMGLGGLKDCSGCSPSFSTWPDFRSSSSLLKSAFFLTLFTSWFWICVCVRELKLDRSWKENEGFWVFGRLQEKAGMVAALVLLPPCFLSFLLSSPLFLLCSLISVFGCYCVLKICVCVGEMGNFCIKGNGVKFLSLQRKAVNGCWFVQEEGLQRLGDGGGKE